MKYCVLSMCFVCAANLGAQRTWLVDSRGGVGSDFPDLAPAVAAASAGDTILVVHTWNSPPVFYHGAVIDKPLRVIGVSELGMSSSPAPVGILDKIEVRNIPANSEVLLAYLNLDGRIDPNHPYLTLPNGLSVQNCSGRVHLESISYRLVNFYGNGELRFENCADLSMHWCDFRQPGPSILFRNSNVAISESSLDPFYPSGICPEPICTDHTSPTIQIDNSTVRFSDSIVTGAADCGSMYNGPQNARFAVEILSGTLLMGPTSQFYGGLNLGVPVMAVGTAGTAVVDPRSINTGFWGSTVVQNQRIDSVYMERVIRNQGFGIVVAGPPNGFMLLAIGLPMAQAVALPFGDLLLDPNAMAVMGLGGLDQNGYVMQHYSVPAIAPMDRLFAFQAATLSVNGAIGLTRPSVFSISWEGGHSWP